MHGLDFNLTLEENKYATSSTSVNTPMVNVNVILEQSSTDATMFDSNKNTTTSKYERLLLDEAMKILLAPKREVEDLNQNLPPCFYLLSNKFIFGK